MKELGEAINESLADSDQIAEVVTRIKEGGYDIFLVLEATIGVSRPGEKNTDKTSLVTTLTSNPGQQFTFAAFHTSNSLKPQNSRRWQRVPPFRCAARLARTPLGLKASAFMDEGKLAPDAVLPSRGRYR